MQKVLLIGSGEVGSNLHIMQLKERFGEDVIVYTPEQAEKEGLAMQDFVNIPTFKIEAPKLLPNITRLDGSYHTGKSQRNIRRAIERKNKNK